MKTNVIYNEECLKGMDNDKHSVEIARERVKYHRGKPNQLELF